MALKSWYNDLGESYLTSCLEVRKVGDLLIPPDPGGISLVSDQLIPPNVTCAAARSHKDLALTLPRSLSGTDLKTQPVPSSLPLKCRI